ncbi:hypothetical protein Tco_1072943, partial [Tanacetum coccineum]
GNPQQDLKDKGVIDNGYSRHMTGNRSYLIDYEEIDGGLIAFGGNSNTRFPLTSLFIVLKFTCPSLLCQRLDSSGVAFAKRQVRHP